MNPRPFALQCSTTEPQELLSKTSNIRLDFWNILGENVTFVNASLLCNEWNTIALLPKWHDFKNSDTKAQKWWKIYLNKTEWGWGALGGFDGGVAYMFYATDETDQRAWKNHIFNSPSVSLTGHMGALDRLWTVTGRANTYQRIMHGVHARTQEKYDK